MTAFVAASAPAVSPGAPSARRRGCGPRCAARLIRSYPYTVLALAVGIALRAALVPLTHGQDFVVWDLAARYTLAGVNIYAHHPPYPGGPYAYVPFFLYLELPFRLMALHAGLPFTVLGKLPIAAGDVLMAGLIATHLRRRGRGDPLIALGTALYFLNPLVLYNSAYYGRFDAVCSALFLLALRCHDPQRPRAWAFPLVYAAAVAAKSFPIFLLPWLLLREPERRSRVLAALVAVVGGLSLPYLVTSPARFVGDVVLYNGLRLPLNLSWQSLLPGPLPPLEARALSVGLLLVFAVLLVRVARLDLVGYCGVSLLLFLLLSQVVIEQYYLWPLPFLILDALDRRSWASLGLLLTLSAAGFLANPYIHPFGRRPAALILGLTLCILGYVYARLRQSRAGACVAHAPV